MKRISIYLTEAPNMSDGEIARGIELIQREISTRRDNRGPVNTRKLAALYRTLRVLLIEQGVRVGN